MYKIFIENIIYRININIMLYIHAHLYHIKHDNNFINNILLCHAYL